MGFFNKLSMHLDKNRIDSFFCVNIKIVCEFVEKLLILYYNKISCYNEKIISLNDK